MRRILLMLLAAAALMGFSWAIPDANSVQVIAAMEKAVPGFGFRGPGPRGTVNGDSVTLHRHDRFSPAQQRALELVLDRFAAAHTDSARNHPIELRAAKTARQKKDAKAPTGYEMLRFVPVPIASEPINKIELGR